MKILLVHPHGSNWSGSGTDLTAVFNLMPPLGVLSVAAYLESKGEETEVLDCYGRPLEGDALAREILLRRPDAVGFSCTTSSFLEGYGAAAALKERAPSLPVVFGGAHACSVGPSLLDRFPAIDYLVLGEGEATMHALCRAGFRNGGEVPGVGFRDGDGKGRLSSPRELLPDLDALPFPAYRRLEGFPRRYTLPLFSFPKAPNTSVISSRGCPYRCSYCDRSVFHAGFRFNSPEYVVEHLAYLHREHGIRHVAFYDDLFTFDRARVEEFARLKGRRGIPVTYNCIARLEHVDAELLSLLRASGCWQVNFGIESGDPELLRKHRKHLGTDEVGRKLAMVRAAGMRVKGLFMMGFPGETEESIRRTVDFALSLPLDEINVTKFTPFPGAPVYRDIREHGEFDEDWPKMNCVNFVFVPKGLTRERLESLYDGFLGRFYRRPRILAGYAAMAWKSPGSVAAFVRHLPEILRYSRGRGW